MKFVSWNVNGLRACEGHGFSDVFRTLDADFFCLQETKMQAGQLDLQFEGYQSYWCYADKKGYSGTAIFTRHQPLNVTYGIGIDVHDHEGRVVTLEMPDFFLVEGEYSDDYHISCGMKRGTKKHFKRNKKEYKRLSEHIGLIPLVMVSPADTFLIEGGSEERRRLMDVVISQYDRSYIEAMNRYNKALQQRNTMLKQEEEPDLEVMSLWEEQMAIEGERIYACRDAFVKALTPVFQRYYETISGHREQVEMTYISHCQRGRLLEVIQRDRAKDRIMGYSLHGVHRDDLVFSLGGHPLKREGSQGQHKTFVIALKLAQFDFLKRTNTQTTPLLLLDDIFDKLDADRVEQIVKLVASDEFGQIFITDTNREHLDQILSRTSHDYQIFHVENGHIHV